MKGSCHCGDVTWHFAGRPDSATACNCTLCRRYGVLWAYGVEHENITVSGNTKIYIRGYKTIGFHFCASCGCVTYWRSLAPNGEGQRRLAVNLRLAELENVEKLPVRHFDGLVEFDELPLDGKCVADYWF